MYPVDNRDRVVELRDVAQSSVGAPLPVVLSDEHKLLLAYLVEDAPSEGDDVSVRIVNPTTSVEAVALVEFRRYSSFMFGSPNDEAFAGHPLASRGLHPYGAFRIEDSSWIRELERMNRVHHFHNPERFRALEHFIFAFHDSTFECVAEGYDISTHRGSLNDVLSEMRQRLKW